MSFGVPLLESESEFPSYLHYPRGGGGLLALVNVRVARATETRLLRRDQVRGEGEEDAGRRQHASGAGDLQGTSLIRNRHPVGPYSRTMPRLLWRS